MRNKIENTKKASEIIMRRCPHFETRWRGVVIKVDMVAYRNFDNGMIATSIIDGEEVECKGWNVDDVVGQMKDVIDAS